VNNRDTALFLVGLAAVGLAVGVAVSCSDQPKTRCTTSRGRFAATFTPSGPLPDGGLPEAGCAIVGEDLGIETYNPPSADGKSIDIEHATVWIRGQSMTDAISMVGGKDNAHPEDAIGDFTTSTPGDDKFCQVGTMTPAEQDLPGDDAGVVQPTTIKYEWSNVRFVVSPEAIGTQMIADLKYTRDSCTVGYKVTALYPSVECSVDGTAKDFCKCLPYGDPNPDYLRPSASGISPDLFGFGEPRFGDQACDFSVENAKAMEDASKVRCDQVTHLCVLKDDPPQ
jgi:hypothetical protein